MKNYISLISALLIAVFWVACTPKTTEQAKTETVEEPKKPVIQEEGLSSCPKFFDAPNPDQAETAHVLYRDFLKNKNYEEAFKYWKKAFELAPAADGKRDYHFLDGVKLYEQKITVATDAAKKKEYIQKIFDLYDQATECYPDRTTMYKGLKAFKLYYTYRDQASDKEIYTIFKEVIDTDGKKTADFVVNPFTALMVEQFLNKSISKSEAQTYATKLTEIIDYGTKNCKDAKACDRWDIVNGYAPVRLEEFEGIDGFYDCSYYKTKYLAELNDNPDDCETIGTTYGRLKWGKCLATDATLVSLKPKVDKCFPPAPVTPTTPAAVLCKNHLRDGAYMDAVTCYEDKAASADSEKKAQYYLTIAKIYYAHLKKFSTARKYARMASDAKPGWGAPHILIGKLYASSGPLCGPGRGFDSQIVTWVAIDEWNKAKRDAEFSAEANKLIGKYQQFMPTKQDVFMRNLKPGGTFKVPCWIGQSTTIRTAD